MDNWRVEEYLDFAKESEYLIKLLSCLCAADSKLESGSSDNGAGLVITSAAHTPLCSKNHQCQLSLIALLHLRSLTARLAWAVVGSSHCASQCVFASGPSLQTADSNTYLAWRWCLVSRIHSLSRLIILSSYHPKLWLRNMHTVTNLLWHCLLFQETTVI